MCRHDIQNESGKKCKQDTASSSAAETEEDRGHWGSRAEFVLACLGYSVGLGNLWRFPYLAYENGGAAFLVPYLVLLFAVGRPLYMMEVSLGQYSQLGPFHTWRRCAPLMTGLSYTVVMRALVGNMSYMLLLGYSAYFLYTILANINQQVPWMKCDPAWSDDLCYEVGVEVPCSRYNLTAPTPEINCTSANQTSGTQFWKNVVLGIDKEGLVHFGEMGEMQWHLVLSLLFAWLTVFFSLIKGVKSVGKVVYFTATFPFVIIIILLIAGLQLPGATKGLTFLFVPDWSKVMNVTVWRKAAEQVLYSLSVGAGGLVAFGSYNKFHAKVHIDIMILSVLDLVASLMCAMTIFSVLGAMAEDLGIEDISEVVDAGPGLAFITFPEAITRTLPVPHVWTFLFFTMLFTLGMDSVFGSLEPVLTGIYDCFPVSRRYTAVVTAVVCTISFGLGVALCTAKGQYLFYLMDVFLSGFGTLMAALLGCISVQWLYGSRRFAADIKLMLGYTPSIFLRFTWAVLAPVVLLALFIGSLINWKWPLYAGYIPYPEWAIGLGWIFPIITTGPIPFFFVYILLKKACEGDLRSVLEPSPAWGPGCPEARQQLMKGEGKEAPQAYDNLAVEMTRF